MSRSDRDQRGRPRSGKKCPDCSYCRTGKYYKKADNRSQRQRSRTAIRQAAREGRQEQ